MQNSCFISVCKSTIWSFTKKNSIILVLLVFLFPSFLVSSQGGLDRGAVDAGEMRCEAPGLHVEVGYSAARLSLWSCCCRLSVVSLYCVAFYKVFLFRFGFFSFFFWVTLLKQHEPTLHLSACVDASFITHFDSMLDLLYP